MTELPSSELDEAKPQAKNQISTHLALMRAAMVHHYKVLPYSSPVTNCHGTRLTELLQKHGHLSAVDDFGELSLEKMFYCRAML